MTTTTPNATDGRTVGPNPRPVESAELLDMHAVAGLLACSKRHVFRLADAGRMPRAIRIGRLVRWRRADLQEWINAGCPTQSRGAQRR